MALPSIQEMKQRVGKFLNKPLSPKMARVNQALETGYKKVIQPTNNFLANINTRPLSSRVNNPVGKIAAGIVETPYTFLTSVPKTYGQTVNEINSGGIFTKEGQQRTAGRFVNSALDTASGGLLNKARGLVSAAGPAVASRAGGALKDLVIKGAKTGLKTGAGYGAGYGFGSSMEQNKTPQQIALEILKQGALGGVMGGALGGAIPAASGLIKAGKHDINVARGKSYGKPDVLPDRILSGLEEINGRMFPGERFRGQTFDPNAPQFGRAAREVGEALPRPGMSIKDVSGDIPPQFSPKTKPIMPEPSINDFPLLSERTKIAGLNDQRPSAIAAARLKIKPQELNVNNLDLSPEQKMEVAAITGGKPKSRMTNKSVIEDAQSLGTDMSTPSIDKTRKVTAEQLNTRRQVVALEKEFDQIRLSGASDDEIFKQLKKIDEAGTASQAQGTDIARQLAARRILADEARTPMQKVFGLLREAGVDKEKYLRSATNVDFNDANQVVKFYREFVPPKFSEWIDVLRYNSMLSSPLTQLVNISSNLQTTGFVRPITQTITGGVDFIGSKLTGKKQTQFAGEGLAQAKGYWGAVGQGWGKFVDVLKGKQAVTNVDFERMPLMPGSKTEATLSFPSKLLEGMDQFFMTMGEAGETAALKYRQKKGVNVGDITEEAQRLAAKNVFRERLGAEGQGALNDALDWIPMHILQARDSNKPIVKYLAKFTFPFISTPTNLLKQGAEYTPGIGAINLFGAKNPQEVIAKQIFGAATFMGAAALFASGKTTWGEPTNQTQKNEFRAAGMQPYSIKIGDTWYSYAKIAPSIAFPIALVAAINDAQEKKKLDDDGVSLLLSVVARGGQFFADQSYMKSMGGFLDAVQGGESAIQSQVSNYWQQLVPFRALGGWITRMIDDVQRKVDPTATFLEKQKQLLMLNIPGMSDNVPARLDQMGNEIKAQNRFRNALSPIKTSTEDPEMKDFYDTHQSVLKQNREKDQLKEILNQGGEVPSKLAGASGSSTPGVKLINGQYYAKIGEKGYVAFDSEEEAKIGINKENFQKSSKNIDLIDGMVYRRNKAGDAMPPVPEEDYKERLYTAKLTNAYKADDFSTWMKVAQERYNNLKVQLENPTLDELEITEIQNKIDTLVASGAKYKRYGGFKKPKAPKKRKALKFKTSLASLKKTQTTKRKAPTLYKQPKASANTKPFFSVGSGFKVK